MNRSSNISNILRRQLLSVLLTFVLAGCATVPPESVLLSSNMGKDLVALQTAHNNLINQYFGSMEANTNTFVDTVYRTFIIRKTLEDSDIVKTLVTADKGQHPDGLEPLDIMEIFSEEVLAQIESFRAEMLAPIMLQKESVTNDVNQTYFAIINANATITAHLDSVVKVHQSQSKILTDLGLPEGSREKLVEKTVGLSVKLNSKLSELTQLKESLGEKDYKGIVNQVKTIFK